MADDFASGEQAARHERTRSVAELLRIYPSLPSEAREAVDVALRLLDAREGRLVRLHFGHDGSGPRTLLEVGQELGVAHERVRQIEARAISKLMVALVDRPAGADG